jgi:hypothetical protein
MPQYGSTQNLISTNLSQTVDNQGNPIISSDTGFAASPLGYAARAQALFGLPNSTFELTPPDTTAVISAANPLPYWDVQDYSSAVMSGSAIYDSTTNSWGINLNPGTAASGDYITMTTRSYLINDDNLSLRQQALAVVSKVGTYSSTTQWNLELTAAYYDSTNTLLHSGTVATIYDNTTWTSMAGTTTTSGSAINSAAHYVDLQFKLTATAAVTSSTSVTIKSAILQTSTGATGKSFLVADTFTSSGTWTRPTGVNYLVAVIGLGAGGGGAGGRLFAGTAGAGSTETVGGAGGGGGGAWTIFRDLYVGDVSTISIGIGAGGTGGTAGPERSKTLTGTALFSDPGANGAAGGSTTFGTYFTATGGGGGTVTTSGASGTGGIAGTISTPFYGANTIAGGAGGNGGAAGNTPSANAGSVGASSAGSPFTVFPYLQSLPAAGTAGGTAVLTRTASGGSAFTVGAGSASTSGFGGGGGGAAGIAVVNGPANGAIGTASGGGGWGGAGGAGATCGARITNAGTTLGTAGAGGNASQGSGAGGGAGGGVALMTSSAAYNTQAFTLRAGNGGDGSSGYITIVYIT